MTAAFDEPLARALLATACAAAGLPDPVDARLLALGENAVFDLGPTAVVAKVGRGPGLAERARRELLVARWLDGQGVPVVRPYLPEPWPAGGHPVTFWHRLAPAVAPARTADLAPLLLALHRLPEPPFPLGRRDLLGPVDRWLAAAEGHLDPADAEFLRHRKDEFAAALDGLTPELTPGVIHGDALPRNVHVGPDGPVLLDLETVSADLREHDLVVLALSHDRYGVPAEEYRAFTAGYGWDVRDWPGFAVLRGARETASAAWVAQRVPGSPAAAAEFRRRVGSLRDGRATVRWYPF
ncbi:aminoglycoside phosphotransferase family protein [Kitasatospora sp. MAP5-34]|uniref:aminoglycoside phosphotransferase family protein n=1 Tax=Kitasatospora sp. MAP5-34 TaxID=3035102 RepID=UPI0024742DEC|nr:aminoglycoside phosphotransferase family protein [Kitasatospora sp. MAP5-34]MDH6579184.1 aminoglycoside phosphotransferase (APT) family kinase protein [Kitasatospora sp. MAP5-34]